MKQFEMIKKSLQGHFSHWECKAQLSLYHTRM